MLETKRTLDELLARSQAMDDQATSLACDVSRLGGNFATLVRELYIVISQFFVKTQHASDHNAANLNVSVKLAVYRIEVDALHREIEMLRHSETSLDPDSPIAAEFRIKVDLAEEQKQKRLREIDALQQQA